MQSEKRWPSTSHFFSYPAKVAATAPTTEESGQIGRFLGFPIPDAPRGCRMAQSDGLIRLTILSADGQPKAKRSTWSRLSAFPTSPNSRLPPPPNSPLFFIFFTVHRESRSRTKNKTLPISYMQNTKKSKTHRFYVLGEFFFFFLSPRKTNGI